MTYQHRHHGTRLARRSVLPTILFGIALGLLMSVVPRPRGGSYTEFGWPLRCLNTHPVTIERHLTPNAEQVVINHLWDNGHLGPTGAMADFACGWIWLRLPNGRVSLFAPHRLLGNIAIALAAWLTLRRLHLAWRRRRAPRFAPGHCRECGYDLTGNVTGVCPECGKQSASEPRTAERAGN
ncbi:MAG: hypothetical protein PVJ57_10420 [Phycisphaerae bacterium]|jgi:hypothetical protein